MISVLVYGATGHTGQLLQTALTKRGVEVLLGGRDGDALRALAIRTGLDFRQFAVSDRAGARAAIEHADLVVNCAGPFSETACPLAEAAIAAGRHYLDISGDVRTLVRLRQLDADASAAGVMVLPGCAFLVGLSDALAIRVRSQMSDVHHLRVAYSRPASLSRGSMATIIELFGQPVRVCRSGRLIATPLGQQQRSFDFGSGERRSLAVSWPDVFTAPLTIGVPNVTAYTESGPLEMRLAELIRAGRPTFQRREVQQLIKDQLRWLPNAPYAPAARVERRSIVVEAQAHGCQNALRLTCGNPYEITAEIAAEIVAAVAAGAAQPGFQTPGRIVGEALLTRLSQHVRIDQL